MSLSRPLAVFWLLATFVPIGYLLFFLYNIPALHTGARSEVVAQYDAVPAVFFSAILVCWLFVASFIVYLYKAPHIPADKRALWTAVLVFGNILAVPVFWLLYVWCPLKQGAAP
jgi:hypothetical protein